MVALLSPVTAGTVLGNPGTWHDEFGRVELSIDYGMSSHMAPFLMFDQTLRTTYENKVWQLMTDWEAFKSNTSIYDQASMVLAGCLYYSLDESQL
ncbi:MAG: hypothetical protein ACTSRW_08085 [Candidatus Helarchaeota archaeon]